MVKYLVNFSVKLVQLVQSMVMHEVLVLQCYYYQVLHNAAYLD